jgi:putative restriction endonuclease
MKLVTMSMNEMLRRVSNLRIGRVGDHERPHKPALLLAIISMADSGRLTENRVQYGPELFELFREYFELVQGEGDWINMLDPFWRMKSDGLIEHVAKPGLGSLLDAQSTPPAVGQLREVTSYSRLSDEFYAVLQEPAAREAIRSAVISRYFASKRPALEHLIQQERSIGEYERALEEGAASGVPEPEQPVRDQAFRRVVLRAYDYRCAACGLRVLLDDLVLVEAAHLIPWTVSRNNNPRNGMALCRNHHWALDKAILAPTVQMTWSVSSCLDDRLEGHRDLMDLRGRSLLLPRETRFHPDTTAVDWRFKRLRA